MLTVLPIQSKQDQESVCLRCAVPFRAECMAYEARVNDNLVGICQFHLHDGIGHITDFAEYLPDGAQHDNEALFIMARGCLNFIDLCGIHRAFFEANFENEDLIHAIGFRKNQDNVWEIDLTGFFVDHCHNHPESH